MSISVEIVLIDDVIDLLLRGLHAPEAHSLSQ